MYIAIAHFYRYIANSRRFYSEIKWQSAGNHPRIEAIMLDVELPAWQRESPCATGSGG
ncbi:MAG: hypothetical protein AAB322_04195 [Pseudomonadota bacterium]